MNYKTYTKSSDTSYTFGGFPTYELLKNKPHEVREIILHDKIKEGDESNKIIALAKQHNIKISKDSRLVEKLSGKGNVYIVGIFKKYQQHINHTKNQILLHSPSDCGNLGTIARVMLGFGYTNLAIIKPCADIFDPKTIRASMGAIFSLNIELFDTFEDYVSINHNHIYPFMLKGSTNLQNLQTKHHPHTLAFGNEAHGLDDKYLNYGTPILIKHSPLIDSLNLSMSVGIALYEFTKDTL